MATITGTSDANTLRGTAGADAITGSGGDTMTGAGGADRFVYLAPSDSTSAAPDVIWDFGGDDVLDLSAITTVTRWAGVGPATADRKFAVWETPTHSAVKVDVTGDGVGDMTVKLKGAPVLSEANVLLAGGGDFALITQRGDKVWSLRAAGREADALDLAMQTAADVLDHPTDELRLALRQEIFLQFPQRVEGYQAQDFEIVDYHMRDSGIARQWLRDMPSAKDLASGNYFTVVGASQFYGRGVEDPMGEILSNRLGIPCLNLGISGAGPVNFLGDPGWADLINGGRFAIVQTMSGRSIEVPGEPKDYSVIRALDELRRTDPAAVPAKIEEFHAIYRSDYEELAALIDVPAAMLFTSTRKPGDWTVSYAVRTGDWGDFPHLVDAALRADVAALFDASFKVLEAPPDLVSYSRFTGEPAPHFAKGKSLELEHGYGYYPSQAAHVQMANAVDDWAAAQLSGPLSTASIAATSDLFGL
jgi:hypothetical protein